METTFNFTTEEIEQYFNSDLPNESRMLKRIILEMSKRIDVLEKDLKIANLIIQINRDACMQGF